LDSLMNESGSGTGNYGQLDQRAAMLWVQNNIKNFGGDPTKVMIFGESAGAISVCHHLAAPNSAFLFRAGLMESGFCLAAPLETSIGLGNQSAELVGCSQGNEDQLACLRATSAEYLLEMTAPKSFQWLPTIDGFELEMAPLEYITSGNFNEVPMIIGNNRDETGLFECPVYVNVTESGYVEVMKTMYGPVIGQQIVEIYPAAHYSAPVQALIAAQTDMYFICPAHRAARAIMAANLPVYLYEFAHPIGFATPCQGASHSFELPFIFTELNQIFHYQFTPQEQLLSNNMTSYWIQFAKYLDPNFEGSYMWPLYSDEMQNIILDLELATEIGWKRFECEFWDSIANQI